MAKTIRAYFTINGTRFEAVQFHNGQGATEGVEIYSLAAEGYELGQPCFVRYANVDGSAVDLAAIAAVNHNRTCATCRAQAVRW